MPSGTNTKNLFLAQVKFSMRKQYMSQKRNKRYFNQLIVRVNATVTITKVVVLVVVVIIIIITIIIIIIINK